MIIEVCCVHELPAGVADIIDRDYLCPIIILSRPTWTKPDDKITWITHDVYFRRYKGSTPTEGTRLYTQRYDDTSYYVLVDIPEITEEACIKAIERLNQVKASTIIALSAGNINHTFKYVKGSDFYDKDS